MLLISLPFVGQQIVVLNPMKRCIAGAVPVFDDTLGALGKVECRTYKVFDVPAGRYSIGSGKAIQRVRFDLGPGERVYLMKVPYGMGSRIGRVDPEEAKAWIKRERLREVRGEYPQTSQPPRE